MATVPVKNRTTGDGFISVREYLRTSYSPDCEYVDGRIVERNVGDKGHSILQMFLAGLFWVNRTAWGVEVYPGVAHKAGYAALSYSGCAGGAGWVAV